MKLIKLSTLAFSFVFSTTLLTACGNKQEKSADESTSAQAGSATAQEGDSNSPAQNMAEYTLTNIPLITAIYKNTIEGITDEQKICLDNIDLESSSSQLVTIFSDNFSDEELEEALVLFTNPEVKKGIDYAMQMVQISSGVEVEDPIAPPSPDTMKKLQDMSETELGQKFQAFTGADDIIQQQLSVEVKECGIENGM